MLGPVLCRWTCRPFPFRIVRNVTYNSEAYSNHLWTAPAGLSKDKGKGKATDAGAGAMQPDLQAIPSQHREKHYLHPKSVSSSYLFRSAQRTNASNRDDFMEPPYSKYVNSGARHH